jgi:predicted RNase H-like nuclease (RuvC/YqgF family)
MTERQQISFLLHHSKSAPKRTPSSFSPGLPTFQKDEPEAAQPESDPNGKRGKKKRKTDGEPNQDTTPPMAVASPTHGESIDEVSKLKNEILKLENSEKELKKALNDMKKKEQAFTNWKGQYEGEVARLKFENHHWKTEIGRLNFELQRKEDELEKMRKGGKAQTFTPKLLFKSEAVNM